jgi:twitching motility protein PilT
MARLDPIIEKLFKDSGQELTLETGGGVNMRTATGLLPVLKQNLTTQQIIGALAELLPTEQRAAFPPEGVTHFPYTAPAGQVQVTLENGQGRVKVSLVPLTKLPAPGAEQEEKLELASPYEMLELAAQGSNPTAAVEAFSIEQAPAFASLEGMPGMSATPAPVTPAPTPAPSPAPVVTARPAPPPVLHAVSPAPAPAAPALHAVARGPATLPPVPGPAAPVPAPTPVPAGRPALTPVTEAPGFAAPSPAIEEGVSDHKKDAEAQMLGLMEAMLARGASDLHLSSETVPHLRIDGDMMPVPEYGRFTHERLKAMLFSIAPEKNRRQWEELHDTDFAYEAEAARFRINVFEDRKGIGAVLRQIPNKLRTAEEIGLSKHVLDLCFLTKGLVLVTGPTGSGKSTTLAALVDYINRHREDHIITIEDPIEFVHRNKNCLVNQREVGVHTQSFRNALRAALREDPDVVLVGEMRDLETIAMAIETAETGHLVFGTLHTNTAASTVDRIIDQFPADRQAQIRMMLSESLKGVIAQTLCKRIGGGRVAAQEVLLCSGSVSNLIREGKTFQLPSVMQTSRGQGMVMLNDSLLDLVRRKVVEPNEALSKSTARAELRSMLERAGFKVDPLEATSPPR